MRNLRLTVNQFSINQSKEKKDIFYFECFFVGGSINISVNEDIATKIIALENCENIIVDFEVKPISIVKFNRSFVVFEPVKVLNVTKEVRG